MAEWRDGALRVLWWAAALAAVGCSTSSDGLGMREMREVRPAPVVMEEPDTGDGMEDGMPSPGLGAGTPVNDGDQDRDGIPDDEERPGGMGRDTDGDGTPDHLDADDDGDGIITRQEARNGEATDSDDDGTPDYLDDDDDDDGIPTADELIDGQIVDSDDDGTPDHLDTDTVADLKECAQAEADAELRKKPVDIIIIIDNSGTMSNEIDGIQQNLNVNFASILEASGIDYRLIMVAEHGPLVAESICIDGTLNPNNDCSTIEDGQPATLNPPLFFHYNLPIGSTDSWCRLLESYGRPDRDGLSTNGWSEWLRPEALKVFLEISDDRVACAYDVLRFDDGNNLFGFEAEAAAAAFDEVLLGLSEAQFGTADERNYIWHSIVALSPNNPETDPWLPTDPVITTICATAAAPGTGYQALSNLTGGLKFPVCEGFNFDVVFETIAEGVIEGTAVDCEFPVPEPPPGETIDRATVEVIYTPSDMSGEQFFREVPGVAACAGNSVAFYFDGDIIRLCTETCDRVQSDAMAAVDVRFGCELPPQPPPPPLE